MKLDNSQFEMFLEKADILTQQPNGMSLGEIYMTVLKEDFPRIYTEIHDTELNVYIHRGNIPLLFTYLFSNEDK